MAYGGAGRAAGTGKGPKPAAQWDGRAFERKSAFSEIDCVADVLPSSTLTAVKRRALDVGHGADALAAQAADALPTRSPQFSARDRHWPLIAAVVVAALAAAGALYAVPERAFPAIESMLCAGFLAWTVLRLLVSFFEGPPPP